jgi:hypothetical protein
MHATEPSFDSAEFQRAFVAASYALGVRGVELTGRLVRPGEPALSLCRALSDADRNRRAAALGAELLELAKKLDARRLA